MIKKEWILEVIFSFYEKAKNDVLIGYHFRNIKDFDSHIPRIVLFWEIQLIGKSKTKLTQPFDVLKAHVPLNIKRGELGRWLVLFRKTLDEKLIEREQKELKNKWLEKLVFFEGTFTRFFGLK